MRAFTQGMIIPLEGGLTGGAITFQWNPAEVHRQDSANWVPLYVAGRELPYLQYAHGRESILRFTLRFTGSGSSPSFVGDMLDNLRSLMEPSIQMASLQRPPRVIVMLGNDLRLTCVLRDCRTRRHTYATPDGLQWLFGDAQLIFSEYQA